MNNLYKSVLSLCGLFIISLASVQAQLQFPELILENDGLELDDSYTVSFTDEIVDPSTYSVREIFNNTELPTEEDYVVNDMYLFDSGLGFFFAEQGYFIEFSDGTATVSVSMADSSNDNFKMTSYYKLDNGRTWQEIQDQSTVPVGYRNDQDHDIDPNDWTYYLLNDSESYLYGADLLKGSQFSMSHSPLNDYYHFQVGVGTVTDASVYGGNTWFYADGELVIREEVDGSPISATAMSPQGGFKHNLMSSNGAVVLRTYTITNNQGFVSTQQMYKVITPLCPADYTQDGEITSSDLSILLADYGCLVNCASDLTGDGAVLVNDVSEFLANFGVSCE
ncbi:MAG: hypothetical protein AB8B53_14710 [Flavobacteriales bacterium]